MAAERDAPLIRPAEPRDVRALADVHTRTWQAAYEHVFGAGRLPGGDSGLADGHTRTWQAAYEHVFGAGRLAAIDPAQRLGIAQHTVAAGGAAVAELGG